jgi:chaperonin GroEL
MTIASNAGVDGATIIGKLIEQEDLSLGYDAARGLCFLTAFAHFISKFEKLQQVPCQVSCIVVTKKVLISNLSDSVIHSCILPPVGEYVDMIKAGIIDPVKVIRTALQDAARYNLNSKYRSCWSFCMTKKQPNSSKMMFFLYSVSLLMTTTDAAVAELPATKSRIASRMPQMSGMDF